MSLTQALLSILRAPAVEPAPASVPQVSSERMSRLAMIGMADPESDHPTPGYAGPRIYQQRIPCSPLGMP
ncbi:MAG TPA: hypothetical protein VLI06_07265 [Solimonas sp.]|nr:hypothetical protein [Solimonas sp.]